MARAGVLALALCAAARVSAAEGVEEPLTRERVAAAARSAVGTLLSYYDAKNGWVGNTSGGSPFWTTANAVESLANYMQLTGDATPMPFIVDIFGASFSRYCGGPGPEAFCFFDDHLWYVLAWERVAAVSGNATFLAEAEALYADILVRWGGWNTTCGGIKWEKDYAYVNAIPNELFLAASGRLATASGNSSTPVSNFTYSEWARVDWAWFAASPMPLPQPGGGMLITDGLSTFNCSQANPSGEVWTYNQGVVLSGLSQLAAATGDARYAAAAIAIADAAIAYFAAPGVPGNIMYEVGCGGNGACGGQDGKQFKGVFVRHLAYALPVLAAASPDPPALTARYTAFILNQTASLLAVASTPLPGGGLQFGQLWQGPFAWDGQPWVSQGSALDVLNAALTVL
jgi:predicted alpha-1,6-mannanase (GH76 family)